MSPEMMMIIHEEASHSAIWAFVEWIGFHFYRMYVCMYGSWTKVEPWSLVLGSWSEVGTSINWSSKHLIKPKPCWICNVIALMDVVFAETSQWIRTTDFQLLTCTHVRWVWNFFIQNVYYPTPPFWCFWFTRMWKWCTRWKRVRV